MAELDEIWADLLLATSIQADSAGRGEVAEYLRLKIENDKVRQLGVQWITKTLVVLAFERSQTYPPLQIDQTSPHAFEFERSNMVGALVRVQQGIRCLSLEVGWARTPTDGIMRKGALAIAKLTHFGMSGRNSLYKLIRNVQSLNWVDENDKQIHSSDIDRHLDTLLGS